jgi:hypothetical protein
MGYGALPHNRKSSNVNFGATRQNIKSRYVPRRNFSLSAKEKKASDVKLSWGPKA